MYYNPHLKLLISYNLIKIKLIEMTKLNLKVIDMENSIVEFARKVTKLRNFNPDRIIDNQRSLRGPP
jgi:hypothetical protein